MSTSSTNIEGAERPPRVGLLERVNADDAPAGAVILELHAAADLGKERVVLAEADVQARLEPPPALTHENRSAGHDVAVEPLDAQTLRIAVASVPRAPLTFFGCHYQFPVSSFQFP